MCIIIDANTMGEFTKTSTAPAQIVLSWVARQGRIVYNDELAKEYSKNGEFLRVLLDFQRAGRATRVDAPSNSLGNDVQLCVSNDIHIVALAKISKASVLFSFDQDLHIDYKNNDLVGRHDRIVFQNENHRPDIARRRCP